jgi:hypothetical protein
MPVADKSDVFEHAKNLSRELNANVKSYLSKANEFNTYDTNQVVLTSAFNKIGAEIENSLRKYAKQITVRPGPYFLYDIIDRLTDSGNPVHLTQNNIDQFLSYRNLTKDTYKEKAVEKLLEELKKKMDGMLEDVRKKLFLGNLRNESNIKPLRFLQVNNFVLRSLVSCKIEDIKYLRDPAKAIKEGLYFIEAGGEHTIRMIRDMRQINYSFRLIDMKNDCFCMHIQGSIKVNEKQEYFYIYEKYLDSQVGTVFNVYNLRTIVDVFAELAMGELRKNIGGRDDDGPNDIDDWLDGKTK